MNETREYPKLRKWFGSCLLGILVGSLTIFYGLLHLGLRVPIKSLLPPFLVIATLTLLLAPGLYWSWKQYALHHDQYKRLYLISGVYTLFSLLVYLYYGSRLGLLTASNAHTMYVLALIAVPVIFFAGFYIRKTLFAR